MYIQFFIDFYDDGDDDGAFSILLKKKQKHASITKVK